tara:strand:+ start:682 stop:1149 length:468 start_codon:yes stop_codon:yes gene_type:complete
MAFNKFGQNPLFLMNRKKQSEVDGSPVFSDTNPEILDSAEWTKNYDAGNNTEKRFLPFDQIVISNNQTSPIDFYINEGGDPIFIPGSHVEIITRPIRSWKIRNISGSTISAYSNGTGIVVDVSKTRLDADKDAYLKKSQPQNPLDFVSKIFGAMV